MKKYTLVQGHYSALLDTLIEETIIGEYYDEDDASHFLEIRGYTYDPVRNSWIQGNKLHYPVTIEVTDVDEFALKK